MKLTRQIATMAVMVLIATTAVAQTVKVTGRVTDRETQAAIEFADVAIFDTAHKVVEGAYTDEKGNFEVDIPKGNYRVEVEYLGYKKASRKLTVIGDKPAMQMGAIRLKPDVEMLEVTVVEARAVAVQTKGDTTEYNAQSFKVNEGATIEALVKKLPGAQISNDGKITVNGKEIKKILVDGKEFFSDDPTVALKNLPANMVEKVSAYERQSDAQRLTGMDDDEGEAVLDLSVKKGMKKGWMGNAQAGIGGTPFHFDVNAMANRIDDDQMITLIGNGNDINNQAFGERGGGPGMVGSSGKGINTSATVGVNYAKDKDDLKYGGNTRYGYTDNDARKVGATEFFQENGSTFERDTSSDRRKRHDVGLDLQTNWKPSKNASLIVKPNVRYSRTSLNQNKRSHALNTDTLETNNSHQNSETEGDNLGAGGTVRYVQKLGKTGRSLSLDGNANYDYSQTDAHSNSTTFFQFYDEDGNADGDSTLSLRRKSDDGNSSMTYQVGASYVEPISTHHKVQARYTFKQRNTRSHSYTYNEDEPEAGYIDSISSKTKNSYYTHQMELSLQGKYDKMRYKVGFNLSPQTSHSTTTVGPNAGRDLSQTVWNYSPDLMARYAWDKKHSLMIRYRGQSSAPSVENLQAVIDQSDPLNIQYGNPDLKPSYNNNLRARYNNYISSLAANLNVNASFTNTLNAITNVVTYDEKTGARSRQKVNVNGNWNAQANASYYMPIGNSPLSVSLDTRGSMGEDVGYSSNRKSTARKSTTKNTGLSQRAGLTFTKGDYEIGIDGQVKYVNARNNLNSNINQETYDYGLGANATVALPWKLNLGTDISYNFYNGYAQGLKDDEVLWNAELSRTFLKNNAATLRLKVVDILQQKSNLTRTTSASSIKDATYNTLGNYFMVYFAYRFNSFGKGLKEQEVNEKFDFGPGGPRGGGRGGFGGGRDGGPRGDFGGEWRGRQGGFDGNGDRLRRPRFDEENSNGESSGRTARDTARMRRHTAEGDSLRPHRRHASDSLQAPRTRRPRHEANGENGTANQPLPMPQKQDSNSIPNGSNHEATKEE